MQNDESGWPQGAGNHVAPGSATVFDATQDSSLLEESGPAGVQQPTLIVVGQKHKRGVRLLVFGVLIALLGAGGLFTLLNQERPSSPVQSGSFGTVNVPLNQLEDLRSENNTAGSLKVNGSLRVADSLLFTPTARPTNPSIGQLYYDQTDNQLSYYNGQEFVGVGGSVTNVTNVLSGSGAGVQLQATSPGTQQTGHFNISGTGMVGTLKTSVIDSSGTTLYVNPLSSTAQQQFAPGTSATLGLTSIGATNTGAGLNNTLIATKATMGTVGGTANSITVYIAGGSAAQQIQVALYEDDGDIPSHPGALLGASAITNVVPNSFNTLSIPSVALTANNTYWMAFSTNDATLSRNYNGNNNASCFYGFGFGFMPNPFAPAPCFFSDEEYTIYVNYTVGGGGAGTFSQAHMVIGSNGQTVFQNSSDSTTAFQVQNAAGTTTIFNVDTANGRIGIGKATPAYRLDIAGGDLNLSTNRSIRFGGGQALTVNATGDTTAIVNLVSGGKVTVQADNFVVQDANGAHQNLLIGSDGAATFSNRINSTTAFQIQNATGTVLLRGDTTGDMQLIVGNATGSATPVILRLANKNTSGDPATGAEGGMYYNSTLQTFRCYYSGFWQSCGDIEPQHTFSQYDEFVGGQTSFTGSIGSLGWNAVAIGANGSLAVNPATPTPSADRPGVLHLQTPAVANQGTTLLLGDGTGGSMIIARDNNVKTAVAMGAATNQVLRVGLHNETSTTTQPISGVWWEANPAASANWRYCYGDGAAATCAASAVAIAVDTWVRLEIRVTATGSGASAATFVINGTALTVSGVTIDTTNRVSPALSCYTTTGTAQNCYWDYFQLTGTTSAAR